MTTIVTVGLDDASQHWFDALRKQYYPPVLNKIPAHVTMFHRLPGDRSVRHVLAGAASRTAPFQMHIDGVESMGRGVTYTLESAELTAVHRELAASFSTYLTPQDKQPFSAHVVVQNKVEPSEARALLAQLQMGFVRRQVSAEALLWWEYLGGPWRLIERFAFSAGDGLPQRSLP